MKSIVCLLFIVVSLEFVQVRGIYRLCDTEGDCEETECCLARSHAYAHLPGLCRPRGFMGQFCSPDGMKLGEEFGGKFVSYCNCREKNECVGRILYGDTETKAWNFYCRRAAKPDEPDEPDEPEEGF